MPLAGSDCSIRQGSPFSGVALDAYCTPACRPDCIPAPGAPEAVSRRRDSAAGLAATTSGGACLTTRPSARLRSPGCAPGVAFRAPCFQVG